MRKLLHLALLDCGIFLCTLLRRLLGPGHQLTLSHSRDAIRSLLAISLVASGLQGLLQASERKASGEHWHGYRCRYGAQVVREEGGLGAWPVHGRSGKWFEKFPIGLYILHFDPRSQVAQHVQSLD